MKVVHDWQTNKGRETRVVSIPLHLQYIYMCVFIQLFLKNTCGICIMYKYMTFVYEKYDPNKLLAYYIA